MNGKYSGKPKPAPEDGPYTPDQSAWAEVRNCWPVDIEIRAMGWAIHGRPKNGDTTWVKNGIVKTQSDVLCG
jgi:hypothetical protein